MGKESEFLEACRDGNVIKVEHLLATKNKKSIVPFVFSKTASALLQSKDSRGSSPLHLAALNGRKAVVYLLLDEGADVTAADENGCLALHLASWNGHYDIVSALISRDRRQETINALTKNQETALHFAAQYGHSNIVTLLLRNGAYPVTRNLKGETALDLSAKYGRVDVVRCLLEANPNMVLNALVNDPKEGDAQLPPPFSPLHLAARNGKTEVVRTLLDAGFDINFFTEEGTALHVAALFGKIDVVKMLLERGINADARDFHGRTALELLDEHQAGKTAALSQLLPNRDAWQHCSAIINNHLEQSSETSSVSREVAAIYLNAQSQQQQENRQHQQQQRQSTAVSGPPNASATSPCESVVWLPIPASSVERMNFEQGIVRSPSSTLDSKRMAKPLSVLTNFHVPPPPSSDSDSICSTISLTATPTPSPALTGTPSSMSPRFPVDCMDLTAASVVKKEEIKPKPSRPPRTSDGGSAGCTYQPPPMQYDNVPRPAVFPHTAYDNVCNWNAIGYDNVPPPEAHAWNHECCKSDGQHSVAIVEEAEKPQQPPPAAVLVKSDSKSTIEGGPNSIRVLNQSSPKKSPPQMERPNSRSANSGTVFSVKFAEAPPETLYLPVEAKLYTRMDQPFVTVAPDEVLKEAVVLSVDEPQQETSIAAAQYGPYDNVPIGAMARESVDPQKKSPDISSSEVEREFHSMQLIEQTIQNIEQSSKDMEENVDAMVRSPSRASQRSSNNNSSGSRPVTPSNSPKKLSKVPPPVSPKPKFLLAQRAPLAQPEQDDLGTSTETVDYKAALFANAVPSMATLSDDEARRTIPKRFHHRSTSHRRSSLGQDQASPAVNGNGGTGVVSHKSIGRTHCVDTEAQVDTAASSECGGSLCSCSGGSQCSLANSGAISANEDGGDEKESTGNVISPIDEQAEWRKIEDIFKSCGTRIARLSVFDQEIKPNLTSYLKGMEAEGDHSSNGQRQSMYMMGTVEQWLGSIGLEAHKDAFLTNGFDRLDFLPITIDENRLRSIGISNEDEIKVILDQVAVLPQPTTRVASSYRYVSDWLQAYGCQDYLGEFVKHGYDTIWKVLPSGGCDFDQAFGGMLPLGHRLRLSWSLAASKSKTENDGDGTEEMEQLGFRTPSFPCDESEKVEAEAPECLSTFSAHYLGSSLIDDMSGMEATRISMAKLKKATKEITKVPQVALEITWRGVRVYDSASRRPLCDHAVQNIHCVCQDERDMNCFAYITKDGSRHFCHVFSVLTADIATDLILTLGKAFEIAYQKALRNASF